MRFVATAPTVVCKLFIKLHRLHTRCGAVMVTERCCTKWWGKHHLVLHVCSPSINQGSEGGFGIHLTARRVIWFSEKLKH
jgi:hypothetical protein